MKKKAIIVSIAGLTLSIKEKKLFRSYKPWGIILFKRNIDNFKQIKKLTSDIKKIMGSKSYPILIDEEGGTVSRLKKILDNSQLSQHFFGELYKKNKNLSINLYKIYINTLSKILNNIGININTVPVLDIKFKKTHKIIIKRSYSSKINVIKKLGSICINQFKKNKILTVIKHIPGHGSATKDSHLTLPIVNKSVNKLYKQDFKCFKGMNSDFAMTAHVLYSKIDNLNCATHSKKIINLIRKKIKFKGIIISDDISMKALKKDLVANALKSLTAGCNLVLHCSGRYSETKSLLKKVPYIDKFIEKKTSQFYKFLS